MGVNTGEGGGGRAGRSKEDSHAHLSNISVISSELTRGSRHIIKPKNSV